MSEIEWVSITKFKPAPIGAIGFIGDDAVAVVSFFDDADGNKDGKVSLGEKIISKISPLSVDGMGIAEVAMQARVEMDVILRDPSFSKMAAGIFLNFAKGLIADGIYAVYFGRGVKMSGKGIAKVITSSMVKQLVVRKGFEKAVREAFDTATGT